MEPGFAYSVIVERMAHTEHQNFSHIWDPKPPLKGFTWSLCCHYISSILAANYININLQVLLTQSIRSVLKMTGSKHKEKQGDLAKQTSPLCQIWGCTNSNKSHADCELWMLQQSTTHLKSAWLTCCLI